MMIKHSKQVDGHLRKVRLSVDGRVYAVQVLKRVSLPACAPRLVVVAYQPNEVAQHVLQVCIRAIQCYTPEQHELWVVDNNSPRENTTWLLRWHGINVVLNFTEPVPPQGRGLLSRWRRPRCQQRWGSYANAVALEIAVRSIDPQTRYLMTLHLDTMPCRMGWLSFLQSRLDEVVRAAGVRMDRVRTPGGVLHVLGCLVDFQLFRALNLDFLPRLPDYDVGDRVTVALREAGYEVFACPNTLWEPYLVEKIPLTSPLRNLQVDRSFDDEGQVIFLHLGRAIIRSTGGHEGAWNVNLEDWMNLAKTLLLRNID